MRKLDNPPVITETLEEVVRRILAAGSPLKIVLFGSQAREETHPGSDLDILVVEESSLPRYQRARRYLRVLVGVYPAKDVVVWTPQEIEAWLKVPNAFITTALREGKTLYARCIRTRARLVSQSRKRSQHRPATCLSFGRITKLHRKLSRWHRKFSDWYSMSFPQPLGLENRPPRQTRLDLAPPVVLILWLLGRSIS